MGTKKKKITIKQKKGLNVLSATIFKGSRKRRNEFHVIINGNRIYHLSFAIRLQAGLQFSSCGPSFIMIKKVDKHQKYVINWTPFFNYH